MQNRTICWFSYGAASAVAAKLILAENPKAVVVAIALEQEHPDNERFARECENWFEKPIQVLTNEKYRGSVTEVIRRRKFIKGPNGAPCTLELKKSVRKAFQKPDDIHVFGYTHDEQERVNRLLDGEPLLKVRNPLIEQQLSKEDCYALLARAGIELPAMYRLGYNNNNCIGCVKGGIGYWNKIRKDFPATFAEFAKLEREVGHSINKREGEGRQAMPVFLDELEPAAGDYTEEPDITCGIFCLMAEPLMTIPATIIEGKTHG